MLKFKNDGNNKEYKVKAICNSTVYTNKSESFLPGLYFLVLWKSYLKEENTWRPALAVLHLCKLINTFYHDYLEKPTTISPPINSIPPMARPTIKPKAEVSSIK